MFYEIMQIAFPVTFIILAIIVHFAVENNWKIAEWF